MSEHIRRIFVAAAIFAAAAMVYEKWREGRGGYGLFDLVGGRPADIGSKMPASSGAGLRDADVPGLAKESDESAKLAAAVLPSVVRVNVGARGLVQQRDIFGFLRSIKPGMVPTSLGSGVIVSKEGHVITNLHVLQGGQQVQVTTPDHKTYDTKLVGIDADLDLAVLQITEPGPFPALSLADSDKVRMGEVVFALGSPFGLEFTLSRGIISATQRKLGDTGNDYIQTDATINPGNSGGPLVNHRGEVVGINVSLYSGDQNLHTWQGIGLAIPANDVKEAYEAITGKRPRFAGYLGFDLEIVRILMGNHLAFGALVTRVVPGSPAEHAGLQKNDIIAQFNDANIVGDDDILHRISHAKPGQTIKMTVLRHDQEISLTAVVEKKPDGR